MKSIHVPKLRLEGKSFLVNVPSSKSIANRALILAALSDGSTSLKGDFDAEDIRLLVGALKTMGLKVLRRLKGLTVENDLSWVKNSKSLELFLGNSGTSMRFLTSLVCLRQGVTVLTGKRRMTERPIKDLVDALRQMGAHIKYLKKDGYPPLEVNGRGGLKGGKVRVKGDVSSQFLTSLLLIGPACEQGLEVEIVGKLISEPYLEMTTALLKDWHFTDKRRSFVVEGDASAAVYWWALGFLHDCKVTVKNVPKNSLQGDSQFLTLLKTLKGPKNSEARTIDMNDMPDASLMLMAIAPLLKFPLKIVNIASLRVKETDRIAAMATELKKLGVKVKTGRDWISIDPLDLPPAPSLPGGGVIRIDTYDDHRIAMSMAILGTQLGGLKIMDPDCVSKSYPNFWKQFALLNKKPRR